MTDKRTLRARMRATRDRFVAGNPPFLAADARFAATLSPGLTVASYLPVGSEADPAALVAAARAAGCRLALPHVVDRATPLRFLAWREDTTLAEGPFGLRQPPADGEEVVPDLILTPLLAFDAVLHRLGQGAGHYDRAFAAHPAARRVGVAWSAQRVDALPADAWDMPLHAVITEERWWNP